MRCSNCLDNLDPDDKGLCKGCLSCVCDGCPEIIPNGDLKPDFDRTDGTWFCPDCRTN